MNPHLTVPGPGAHPATVRITTVAAWFGVPHKTIHRLAVRWHPNHGAGHPIELDPVDVLVCRALLAIAGPHARRLGQLAETAIRAHPDPWLVLSVHATSGASAVTCPSIEDAARSLLRPRQAAAYQVIDLWPPAWTTHTTEAEAVAA